MSGIGSICSGGGGRCEEVEIGGSVDTGKFDDKESSDDVPEDEEGVGGLATSENGCWEDEPDPPTSWKSADVELELSAGASLGGRMVIFRAKRGGKA